MRTQGKDSHLPAEKRGLSRNQYCQHLDLRLLASRIVRKLISVVEATQSMVLHYGSLSILDQGANTYREFFIQVSMQCSKEGNGQVHTKGQCPLVTKQVQCDQVGKAVDS